VQQAKRQAGIPDLSKGAVESIDVSGLIPSYFPDRAMQFGSESLAKLSGRQRHV